MKRTITHLVLLTILGVMVSVAAASLGFAIKHDKLALSPYYFVSFFGFFLSGVMAYAALRYLTVGWIEVILFWWINLEWILLSNHYIGLPIPFSLKVLQSVTAIAGAAFATLVFEYLSPK